MDLTGKVILIVGGTRGMGFSAAKACVGAGAKVVVVGRNKENADRAAASIGPNARAFAADALDPPSIPQAVAFTVESFGKLDGVYHCAGGSGRKLGDGPLHQITDSGWRSTVDWNLTTLFHTNRAAVNQFLKQGSPGSILNIGSILAVSPSPHFFATHAYAAAKSAIIGFTHTCASYYAPHDIRFNLVVPALVKTPMSERSTGNPQIMGFMKTKQPLAHGQPMQPSDLDAAVLYFLSDASRFVTGQVLSIDAGWSLSEGQIPPTA
ncbi:MAG: SDR family NAD(P)-dependent oxidoreductase [Tepidisphaeraceae bacterium]